MMSGGGWAAMTIGFILFWVVVIWGIVAVIKYLGPNEGVVAAGHQSTDHSVHTTSPLPEECCRGDSPKVRSAQKSTSVVSMSCTPAARAQSHEHRTHQRQ